MKPHFKTAIFCGICIGQLTFVRSVLWALPSGQSVTHGKATFQNSGSNLIIRQSTDKLITKWGSFSIAHGEKTQFVQPNKNSSALNRVIGGSRSIIDGQLSANGKVILINPAGVTVGSTGVVNVNSFTASTQDLSDEQFLGGGELLYQGTSQESIENLGTIQANGGDAILIAKHVKNAGSIEALNGTAALVGATQVRVMPAGEERIFIAPRSEKSATVTQSAQGRITSARAEIKAAGNPWATAINLDGYIGIHGGGFESFPVHKKRSLVKGEGTILVSGGEGDVKVSGYIGAMRADGTGGSIVLSGQNVELTSTGNLNVDGMAYLGCYRGGTDCDCSPYQIKAGSVEIHAEGTAEVYGNIYTRATIIGVGGKVLVEAGEEIIFPYNIEVDNDPEFIDMNGWLPQPETRVLISKNINLYWSPINGWSGDHKMNGVIWFSIVCNIQGTLAQLDTATLKKSRIPVAEEPAITVQPPRRVVTNPNPIRSIQTPDQIQNDFQTSEWESRFTRKSYLSKALAQRPGSIRN